MMGSWYIKTPDGILGPISTADLGKVIESGVLPANSKVRHGIAGRWSNPGDVSLVESYSSTCDPSHVANSILKATPRITSEGKSRQSSKLFQPLLVIVGIGLSLSTALVCKAARPIERLLLALSEWRKPLAVAGLCLLSVSVPAFNFFAIKSQPSAEELYQRLETVWSIVKGSGVESLSEKSSHDLVGELQQVADAAEVARSLHRPDNIVSIILGHDREYAMLLSDISRLAEYDLPAAVKSRPSISRAREMEIESSFDAIYEHFTLSSSPYSANRRASAKVDRLSGGVRSSTLGNSWLTTPAFIVGFDLLLLVCGIFYWLRTKSTP